MANDGFGGSLTLCKRKWRAGLRGTITPTTTTQLAASHKYIAAIIVQCIIYIYICTRRPVRAGQRRDGQGQRVQDHLAAASVVLVSTSDYSRRVYTLFPFLLFLHDGDIRFCTRYAYIILSHLQPPHVTPSPKSSTHSSLKWCGVGRVRHTSEHLSLSLGATHNRFRSKYNKFGARVQY